MTARHLAALFGIGVLTFAVHEFAHGLAGAALGHPMEVASNHARPADGVELQGAPQILVSIAGPAATLLQALLGLGLVLARGARHGWSLVFAAFLMRLMAGAVSLAHPNDEALVSTLLGWPVWLLPALVVALLLGCAVVASRRLRLGPRAWVEGWLVLSVAITLMVLGEGFLPVYPLPAF